MRFIISTLVLSFFFQFVTAQTNKYHFELAAHNQQNNTNLSVNQNALFDYYDVKFYKLDLSVTNTTDSFGGNVIIQVKSLVTQFDTFAIELSNKLTVDSVFLFGVYHSFIHANDELKIAVSLPITIGTVFSVQVFYHTPSTYLSDYFEKTTTSTGVNVTQTFSQPYYAHEWFPCKQALGDKADSVHIFITTDQNLKAGSNGVLTSTVQLPQNKVRYEWKSRYPIEYYLISITVSDFVEFNLYANPTGSPKPILIQNYIFNDAQQSSNISKAMETKDLLELFSDLYGLYPFWEEKYGHCMFKSWITGMEHQTMSSMKNLEFWLIAHELAHQWFGDNVTNSSWQDIWLHEGFASYSEYLALEFLKTKTQANDWMTDCRDDAFKAPSGSVYVPLSQINNWQRIFNYNLTYRKSACLVHMLRYEIQNDGVFFNALRNFQTQFKDSVATVSDFENVIETVSGKDFSTFFNQWYYGEGYPLFQVKWSQQDDYVTLRVQQSTSSYKTTLFKLPLEFKLYYDNGDTTVRLTQTQNNQFFRINIPFDIYYIEVDPDNWLLQKTDYVLDCLPYAINIGNDTAFCEGDSLNITANHGVGNYLWNDSLSTSYYTTIKSSGEYYLYFTDTNGCTYSSNSINVKVHSTSNLSFSNLDSNYCVNDSPVTLSSNPEGGSFYIDSVETTVLDPSILSIGQHDVSYEHFIIDTFINSHDQTIFEDGFQTNKGWVLTGEFQIGAPTGLGGEHGGIDPLSAYEGINVLGTDVTGLGNYKGDYEPNSVNCATSPSIDCRNYRNVKLKFQRWLNVEQPIYDSAYIEISNNNGFSWDTIWENPMELTDFFWSLKKYNISHLVDNKPNIKVRFCVDSDVGWHYSGWNIDDLKIVGQPMDTVIDTLCTHIIQEQITINPLPEVSLGNDTAICDGNVVTLDAGPGYIDYLWEGILTNSQYVTITKGGIYFVSVTDSNNCISSSDSIKIELWTLPQINIGNNTFIYFDDTLVLDAGTGFTSYLWNDNSTGQTFIVNGADYSPGVNVFTVSVTDSNGCMNSDTVEITIVSNYGVTNNFDSEIINIYPNPSKGIFNLEFSTHLNSEVIIEIFSLNNQLVYEKLLNTDLTSTNYLIDISVQPQGLYFMRLKNNHFVKTIMFSKIH